jgi:hypothetical protein
MAAGMPVAVELGRIELFEQDSQGPQGDFDHTFPACSGKEHDISGITLLRATVVP